MTVLLWIAAILLCLALILAAFMQLLCGEVLRVRPRQQRVVEFLRVTFLVRIGVQAEEGARAFAFYKQAILIVLSFCVVLLAADWEWRNGHSPIAAIALLAWAEALLATLLIVLLFSYVVPQALYRRNWIEWLAVLSPLLRGSVSMLLPFTFLRQFFETLTQFDVEEEKKTPAEAGGDQIDVLISAGEGGGLVDKDDRKLIESVVAFNDKTLREVMTPRPQVVAIGATQTLEELAQVFRKHHYSRYPVIRGSLDEVVGFIHIVDLLMEPQENWRNIRVEERMRTVEFVPETKRIYDELRDMQKDRAHMSVVIDEYGQTAGLVTMEDLQEEIFGEIQDEFEANETDLEEMPDGSIVTRGATDLDLLREKFDFELSPGTESTTVGGLATEWAGYVPRRGEVIPRDDLRIEVLDSTRRQVLAVRVWGRPREKDAKKPS